jgi:hypothetical protein
LVITLIEEIVISIESEGIKSPVKDARPKYSIIGRNSCMEIAFRYPSEISDPKVARLPPRIGIFRRGETPAFRR